MITKKENIKYLIKSTIIDIIIAGILVLGMYIYIYKIPHKLNIQGNISKFETEQISNNSWKEKFKDKFSKEVIITENEYKGPNASVSIQQHSYGEGKEKVTYFIADIYISNIRMLKTRFAQDTYGVGYREGIEEMSNVMKSIVAINGDSSSSNNNKDNGTIIRNGITYRNEETTLDICVLYYDGTMKTYSPQEFNRENIDNIYQTWLFGPKLLDENGKVPEKYLDIQEAQ